MARDKHALFDLVSQRHLQLSGERIHARYCIRADSQQHAMARAKDICLEETVELPAAVIPTGSDIDALIVGRIESFGPAPTAPGHWVADISYAAESAGQELPQLLNLLFGNISIKPGLRLEDLILPQSILDALPGPGCGVDGLRKMTGVQDRPLLCTALKPMGLSADELATLAHRFALGGIDIIKDDHGLTNQCLAPFEERVEKCVQAVARANQSTGKQAIYMPSITAPIPLISERAMFAKEAGAGGVLLTPGLCGFDSLRMLASEDRFALPIMAHPSFLGSFTASKDSGIVHDLIYGLIPRLAGADAVVYPSVGGRFGFSLEEVRAIARRALEDIQGIKPAFPVPAGGMTLDRVPELKRTYGRDAILLMGGGLYAAGSNLLETCRHFLSGVAN